MTFANKEKQHEPVYMNQEWDGHDKYKLISFSTR